MMPAAFLPQQMVDPRKLGLVRMSPYDMAQQQAQMQQMFRLQQMNGIQRPMVFAQGLVPTQQSGMTNQQSRRPQKAKPVKKVIAVNLPEDLQTIEAVTSTFYPYGEILLARVLRPNKALPFDLKQFQKQIPDLGRTVCAIIEFESAPAAKFAVDTLKFRTQELKFRLALLEPGAEEELYGAHAQPQKPLMKAGASVIESAESGIELSASAQSASDRDSATGSPKPRNRAGSIVSSDDDAELFAKAAGLSLTENWNVGVKEFVPSFGAKPAKATTKTVDNKNGRVITSVSISLSKPAGRSTNKIQIAQEKKAEKRITYTRDFLMSRRSATVKNAPKMMNIDGENSFKRYNEEVPLFKPRRVTLSQGAPVTLSPQRRQMRR